MKLGDFRVCVRPGQGLVARFPTAVLVVTSPDWAAMPAVDRLLEECAPAAGSRPLADRLADLLDTEAYKIPAFAALGDDEDGLSFFVHGETQVTFTGAQRVMRMSGRRTAGWTGRVEDEVASLEIGPAGGDADLAAHDDRGDLREGVVPGGAILLVPRDRSAPAAPARRAPASKPAVRPPEPAPTATAPAPPATAAVPLAPTAPTLTAPAPTAPASIVPAYTPPAPTEPPFEDEAPSPRAGATVPAAALDGPPRMVWGIHCKRGHFNDPDARYCRMCGTHMVHQRRDPVLGPRPVLGYLVVDDGSTYKLDADYVIGAHPEVDERVAAGEARGLTLADPEDAVSPAHATIRLDQWAVFLDDLMPRYGTHLWSPGTSGWTRLDPGQKVMLEPRTHILLGRRTMVFDSINRR